MQVFSGKHINRVTHTGADIFDLKIWIISLNDLVKRNPFTNQFKYILHSDSCAGHTRFTKMDIRIDCDSF